MLVFAFDRDWTVDVNPHPSREAVPLAWVRHLAHETDHAVYAIGNQTLAEEAAIPGVVDIVGRHPDDWDRWLGDKTPDGRYERFPSRRDRLGLVADLHPAADGYVVVDDLDLSDVRGWDHYHAWEFVPAVRRGDVAPGLPWVADPVTDGGYASGGIVPASESDLREFLEEFANAPGWELTDTADGTERTRLLASVDTVGHSFRRPSRKATLRCVPADLDADAFRVRAADVEMLTALPEPPDALRTDADAPAARARHLARVAEANPHAVDVNEVLTLLDSRNDDPQADALRAIAATAAERPRACTPAVPILGALLETDLDAPADALAAVRAIAAADPADVAHLADAVAPSLTGPAETREQAAWFFSAVAGGDPADAVDAVPALATVVSDAAPGRRYAVYALSRVSDEFPEAVRPVADDLADTIADEDADTDVRANALSALGRAAKEQPDVALDAVDDVATLFDAEDVKLRNNAIALLSDVAIVHTDVLRPYTDDIAPLLDAEDDYTRINASAALSRVAEDFPETVAGETEALVGLLTDDEPLVRTNACWALGHLGAETALDALERRVHEDDEEQVRNRAAWAVTEIEGGL